MADKTERKPDILDFIVKVLEVLKVAIFDTGYEILLGLRRQTVPLQKCLFLGAILNLAYYLKMDHFLFTRIHLPLLILSGMPRFYACCYLAIFPLHAWGLGTLSTKLRLKRSTKKLFESLGLETRLKETPSILIDEPVDEWTRKLKLLSRGIPPHRYLEKKEEIESMLNASIIKVSSPPNRRDMVEVVYSKINMPSLWKIESIRSYHNFTFPVGITWGREITTSLIDVPHFLIAGESGGGKSTFISMMTSLLLATNENLRVIFVDMKGGMQSRVFEGLKRVETASEPSNVKEKVTVAIRALDGRMALFKKENVRDIDSYNRKFAGKSPVLDRIVLIVDEFSELIPKFNSQDRKILTEINQEILRIARMGRACGIHLVVGIQKPDTNNLDPGIKANLPGIVCFPVTHFSQSMLILGDGRAADLPAEVKGRAVWKYGIEQIEVQTPYISETEIEALRKTLDGKEDKANEKTENSAATHANGSEDSQISVEMESLEHSDAENLPGT